MAQTRAYLNLSGEDTEDNYVWPRIALPAALLTEAWKSAPNDPKQKKIARSIGADFS